MIIFVPGCLLILVAILYEGQAISHLPSRLLAEPNHNENDYQHGLSDPADDSVHIEPAISESKHIIRQGLPSDFKKLERSVETIEIDPSKSRSSEQQQIQLRAIYDDALAKKQLLEQHRDTLEQKAELLATSDKIRSDSISRYNRATESQNANLGQ